MIKNSTFLLVLVLWFSIGVKAQKAVNLTSPDKRTEVIVDYNKQFTYAIKHDGKDVVLPSVIGLQLETGQLPIEADKIIKKTLSTIDAKVIPVIKEKRAEIRDNYNLLTVNFKSGLVIELRAYDNGVAYRFVTNQKSNLIVKNELVNFNLPANCKIYFPEEESMHSHNEREFKHMPVDSIGPNMFSSLPALVEIMNGPKMLITESNIIDYPGFWLKGVDNAPASLTGFFAKAPLEEIQKSDRDVIISKNADYIAKTAGTRTLPWRAMLIADKDGDLIENQMVYLLADPLKLTDVSWIKAGKVAWDWWNANNIYGVDFASGINNQTYKYYIDFASENNLQYIILDEGWYDLKDVTKEVKDINVTELVEYGKKKNVGIILWAAWKTFEDKMDEAMTLYEKWGVKGVKIDFMQRDDQKMVNFYHTVAEKAATHHLLVDFHGAYKPDGISRTYPHVISREGVRGLENNKWSTFPNPKHDLTLPFTRMVCGPMDFTPGAMKNSTLKNFNFVFTEPMSLGTRCHQLAMYVVFESPLQMLADNPSNYKREPECLRFLSQVPTEWDDTKVLDAKVGDYVIVARRNGNYWYIGGMTDWTPRDMNVDLGFLPEGTYTVEIYKDGINADKAANDYKYVSIVKTNKDQIKLHMAPGGGFALRIVKIK
jgi:alpha-glucosidase